MAQVLLRRLVKKHLLGIAELRFDEPFEHMTHFFVAHRLKVQRQGTAAMMFGKYRQVKPHPSVAQDQGHGHEQQPPAGVAARGGYPRFLQLPVAGFDTKPLAIRLANRGGGVMPPQAPTGKDQDLAVPPSLTMVLPRHEKSS